VISFSAVIAHLISIDIDVYESVYHLVEGADKVKRNIVAVPAGEGDPTNLGIGQFWNGAGQLTGAAGQAVYGNGRSGTTSSGVSSGMIDDGMDATGHFGDVSGAANQIIDNYNKWKDSRKPTLLR